MHGKLYIVTKSVLLPVILTGSILVWYQGLRTSPAFVENPVKVNSTENQMVNDMDRGSSPEYELARAYWKRYPDVKKDPHYGNHGTLGVDGPREHFQQHGRREGRVWGLDPDQSTNLPD